jgi:hypothetical protein
LDASARFLARNVIAEGALEQLDLDGLCAVDCELIRRPQLSSQLVLAASKQLHSQLFVKQHLQLFGGASPAVFIN